MMGQPMPRETDLSCPDGWEPPLETLQQLTIEHRTSDLLKQMGASLCPTHVLSLAAPISN